MRKIEFPDRWYQALSFGRSLGPALALNSQRSNILKRAYTSCEQRGLHDLAITIALNNRDWEYIEKAAWRRFVALVRSDDFELLWEWLSQIPPREVRAQSRFAIMSMMAAARRRDFAKMNEAVGLALSTLKEDRKDQHYVLTKIICATVRAVSAERLEARRLIADIEHLPSTRSSYLKGTAEQIVAESYMESDITLMDEKLQAMFKGNEWRGDEYFGKSLLATMTLVNAMLGRHDAQDELDQVIRNYSTQDDEGSSLFMRYHLGKASLCYQRGSLSEALDHLRSCENDVMRSGIEIDRAFHFALCAMLSFSAGEHDIAQERFSLSLQESPLFCAYAFPGLEMLARIFPKGSPIPTILYRDRDGCQPAITRLRAAVEYCTTGTISCTKNPSAYAEGISENRPLERFHWLLLASAIEEHHRHDSKATEIMAMALDQAERQKLTQPVIDSGPLLFPILRRAVYPDSLFQRELLRHVPAHPMSERPIQHLTPREREVAALLDSAFSYSEIAERLLITPATLRKHVKRIFSKLSVHSRSQAVACLRNTAELLIAEKS